MLSGTISTDLVKCQITDDCFSVLGNGCGVFGGKPEDKPDP